MLDKEPKGKNDEDFAFSTGKEISNEIQNSPYEKKISNSTSDVDKKVGAEVLNAIVKKKILELVEKREKDHENNN